VCSLRSISLPPKSFAKSYGFGSLRRPIALRCAHWLMDAIGTKGGVIVRPLRGIEQGLWLKISRQQADGFRRRRYGRPLSAAAFDRHPTLPRVSQTRHQPGSVRIAGRCQKWGSFCQVQGSQSFPYSPIADMTAEEASNTHRNYLTRSASSRRCSTKRGMSIR
jgi:hypothetical protein